MWVNRGIRVNYVCVMEEYRYKLRHRPFLITHNYSVQVTGLVKVSFHNSYAMKRDQNTCETFHLVKLVNKNKHKYDTD